MGDAVKIEKLKYRNMEVPENQNNLFLQTLANFSVSELSTTAPPTDPADESYYIVGSGATGEWAGKDGLIAYYALDKWVYLEPEINQRVNMGLAGGQYFWNGTAWLPVPGGGGGGGGSVNSVNGKAPDAAGNVALTKSDFGLGNVDNTSDADKPISTATQTALDSMEADLNAGISGITKESLGLGNVNNTSDANKPVSTQTQAALDALEINVSASLADVTAKIPAPSSATPNKAAGSGSPGTSIVYTREDHTHPINTASDIGLGNVDNTSDSDKPISVATKSAIDFLAASVPVPSDSAPIKAADSGAPGSSSRYAREDHVHPINTKEDIGLGNVDNTSDIDKPVSTAQAAAISAAKAGIVQVLTSTHVVKVDGTNGDDNDPVGAGAFKTIDAAISYAQNFVAPSLDVQISSGFYDVSDIMNLFGYNTVTIRGQGAATTLSTIRIVNCKPSITFQDLTVRCTRSNAFVYADFCTYVTCLRVTAGEVVQSENAEGVFVAYTNTPLAVNNCTIDTTNNSKGILSIFDTIAGGSIILYVTAPFILKGYFNLALGFLFMRQSSKFSIYGAQSNFDTTNANITGKKYDLRGGSFCDVSGNGPDFFPGSAAGIIDATSTYI